MRIFVLALLVVIACYSPLFSQDSTFHYNIGVSGTVASSGTPFWLHANQSGTVPLSGNFALANAGIEKVYNPSNPRFFDWAGGIEAVGFAARKSDAFFTNLFVAGRVGPVEVSVGQRRGQIGLGDSVLTSGSIAMSQNYRPYPKIEIRTPRYVSLIPMYDILSFQFSYSDGILGPGNVHYGNAKRVDPIYLHQKSIYIKLGRNRHRLNLFGGFNHQVMWGGEDKIFSGGLKRNEAYSYVVFGKPWAQSRVGNHFGTIDVAAEWKGNRWTFFAYRQNIYEDGSLSNLSNIADGLNGFRIKRISRERPSKGTFFLNTVLLEYLYTKNQGGDEFDFVTGTFGRDNYFNHYVYDQGWSYRGRAVGTPFISAQPLLRPELRGSSLAFTTNNRLAAFHFALAASTHQMDFTLKASHSLNYGTYAKEFSPERRQTSLLFTAQRYFSKLKNDQLIFTVAADFGKLYPNSTALSIGWRKSGFIR